MTTVPTSYVLADRAGRALFEQMDTYIDTVLLAGAEPHLQPPYPILLADSTTLPQFAVVGLSGGKLALATYGTNGTDGIRPIGVLAHAAVSVAANVTVRGQVWYSGCFNIGSDGVLVWDASWDTVAKKAIAFLGAPTPTTIVTRERFTPAS